MSKSLAKNGILNIIKTCASIAYPLITFPYVNRILLPDNCGKVDYARSYVSYFAMIASLGVLTYAIRECAAVANDRAKLEKVASQIFSINVCATVVAYAALIISLFFTHGLNEYGVLISIYSLTIMFQTMGADWLNSAMEDFTYITIRTIVFQVISIIAMFVFVRNINDYYAYISILTLSASGANIANIRYRRKYCNIRFTTDMDFPKHIKPILLLFVMQLSVTIFNNVDITMLGNMKDDYQVGIYGTAFKVISLIANVVQSIIFVLLPRLSYFFSKNDYEGANKLLRKLLAFNIILGFPISVGTVMLSSDIVWVVGGDEFLEAGPVLQIMVISFLFSLVGGSFLGNAILIPTKNEKYYMIVCCITAVINVIINALLIPTLAASGAAIATAANGFFIFLLLLLKVDKRIKIERKAVIFIEPIIGCLAVALCCFGCSFIQHRILRMTASISASVVVYFGLLFLMKNEFVSELFDILLSKLRIKKNCSKKQGDIE